MSAELEPQLQPLQFVEYESNGTVLRGEMAVPAAPGKHPAVLVMHNAYGLGEHMRTVVRKLAKLGYIALATDMYGGGIFHTDLKQTGASIGPLLSAPELLRARTVGWFETLAGLPNVDRNRIAAIGYCFGGQCVLELARSGANIKAMVSYHGLLTTSMPAQPGAIKGEVAIYTGAKDPFAPPEHVNGLRAELSAAGAKYQITEFGEAAHAFTDPDAAVASRPGIAYHALSDAISWAGTLALLEETIGA
jgi:dienelactone hydrolase